MIGSDEEPYDHAAASISRGHERAHPDRTPDEIRNWAYEHDLPYSPDDGVQSPDLRIEYFEQDGREDHRTSR